MGNKEIKDTRVLVYMKPSLYADLNKLVQIKKVSRNDLICTMLREACDKELASLTNE